MLALTRFHREKGSGAGMPIRGAESLADVPYWRKTKKRLTAAILLFMSHFLKSD
jgi:hypothetical protein